MNKDFGQDAGVSKDYHLVIFDWEGTLADTVGQALCRIAIEAGQFMLGDDAQQEEYFQWNLRHAAKGFFPQWSDEQIKQFCSTKGIAAGGECDDIA